MKAAIIMALLLSGCSTITGVEITEAERKACEAHGCTVWTQQELEGMARKFFRGGYQAGVKSI